MQCSSRQVYFPEFDDGHPLGGYLFYRFIKFIRRVIWLRRACRSTWTPTSDGAISCRRRMQSGVRRCCRSHGRFRFFDLNPARAVRIATGSLSAYIGNSGVTAAFEKEATRRGLVVREPGSRARWIGARYIRNQALARPRIHRQLAGVQRQDANRAGSQPRATRSRASDTVGGSVPYREGARKISRCSPIRIWTFALVKIRATTSDRRRLVPDQDARARGCASVRAG